MGFNGVPVAVGSYVSLFPLPRTMWLLFGVLTGVLSIGIWVGDSDGMAGREAAVEGGRFRGWRV